MIPKDKAYQLVTRFYLALPNNGSQTGINNVHSRWEEGKMCAAMAVYEILQAIDNPDETYLMKPSVEYWTEVQAEIEKL
jgi:hypothetical protein